MEQQRECPGCMEGPCAYQVEPAKSESALFFGASPDIVALIGFDGTVRRVNPAAVDASGFSEAELLGCRIHPFLHPEDVPLAQRAMARLAFRGRAHPVIVRGISKSGEVLCYEWNSARIDEFSFLTVGRKVTRRGQSSPGGRARSRIATLAHSAAPSRLPVREHPFGSVAEFVPDGIFLLTEDGQVTFGNRRCMEILGREDLVGAYWKECVDVSDHARARDGWRLAARERRPVVVQIRCRRPDGERVWVRCKMAVEAGFSVGTLSDITPFRLVTEQLLEAEQRARRVAEVSFHIVLLIAGPNPTITDINHPGAVLLRGNNASDFLGRPVTDFLHPTDHAAAIDRINTALDTWAASPVLECSLVRVDGTLLPVEGAAIPVMFQGEPSVYVVFRDISERKAAERALRQREHHLASLAKAAPVGIFQTDPHGLCIYTNARYLDITGHAFAEIQGLGWWEHVVTEDRRNVRKHWQRMIDKRGTFELEYRLRRKDGQVIWVLAQAVPESGDDGELLGYIGSITDVSQSKLDEIELRNYREHLEEMVRERTVELEAVNRELESFSYSVSHDLRGPLRAINGFNSALLEEYGAKLDEQAQFFLGRIQVNTRQMSQLIDDLLELSKVTKAELQREWVDLSAMAESMLTEMRLAEPERQVTVSVAPQIRAFADPHLIGVLLQNLLANAWKYTSRNALAKIEFGALDAGSTRAFYVRDDGVGFDMACAPDLFQAFHRLHDASQFEGTGIGLATVHRVVMRHGGRVWAEGKEGKGATFFFVLH